MITHDKLGAQCGGHSETQHFRAAFKFLLWHHRLAILQVVKAHLVVR